MYCFFLNSNLEALGHLFQAPYHGKYSFLDSLLHAARCPSTKFSIDLAAWSKHLSKNPNGMVKKLNKIIDDGINGVCAIEENHALNAKFTQDEYRVFEQIKKIIYNRDSVTAIETLKESLCEEIQNYILPRTHAFIHKSVEPSIYVDGAPRKPSNSMSKASLELLVLRGPLLCHSNSELDTCEESRSFIFGSG